MRKNQSIFRGNYPSFTYVLMLIGTLLLAFTGTQHEPFPLPFTFACLLSGLNPYAVCFFYAITGLFPFSLVSALLSFGSAAFLLSVFLLSEHFHRTPSYEAYFYIAVPLLFWVVFGETLPYVFFEGISPLFQRGIVALFLLFASYVFSFALSAILKKTFRCRLTSEELLAVAASTILIGVGFYRCLGEVASTGILLFLVLILTFCLKNGTIFPVALLLGLPSALITHSADVASALLLYASAAMLFYKAGRLVQSVAVFLAYLLFSFATGLFDKPSSLVVWTIVAGVLPCLLYLSIPDFILEHLEEKLVFYREKKLSRIAINRNRAVTGEKLFEISGVFREIEVAFDTISSSGSEEKALLSIRSDLLSTVCSLCPSKEYCTVSPASIDRLVQIGCVKGKASLIDLPSELSSGCSNPGGILFALNGRITDYKNYVVETENANAGRKLLSEQAKGVSEILKQMAMEQSEPVEIYSEKEREIALALQRLGILCTEILVYGEGESVTVNLITFGQADLKEVARAIGEVLSLPFMPTERMPLGDDKYCCFFKKKPTYSAALGISSLPKDGETAPGDTYSAIRIDEKTVLVALSDGMGSGEYARKLSDSAISLIEGFYRTKMPSETILETVNRLLSFNREEGFVCLDIAVVNLENGEAEIIKIGSPMGFIINQTSLRLLSAETLPLGILEGMHPSTARTTLLKDDILVFLSDGVTGAFGSDADLTAYLQNLSPLNPQGLADELISEAVKLYGGKAADDMTALAVRIY